MYSCYTYNLGSSSLLAHALLCALISIVSSGGGPVPFLIYV